MFARVLMQRLTTALSSRFEVVSRDIVWRSPILLTPYRPDYTIDADRLALFLEDGYEAAGIAPSAVDAGAVILTGEALKRHNARAIADMFSADAGKFVCTSAGHHMECLLGAHGSGAVKLSAERQKTILNVDIGGGTTKLALIRNGEIAEWGVVEVGARFPRGITVARMVDLIVAAIKRISTVPLDAMTFSGGVAEYFYGRETATFGDLGPELADGLRQAIAEQRLAEVWDPGQGIRATVIGAAQFTVEVSGNTILVTSPEQLPLRNVPVLLYRFGETIDPQAVEGVDGPVALAFRWSGPPTYDRLSAVAREIVAALHGTIAAGLPIVLLIDGDVAMSLGRIIHREIAPGSDVIAVDGLTLKEFDYVDIGSVMEPAGVLPVTIKSLLF